MPDRTNSAGPLFETAADISSPEAHARSIAPADAQRLCNFVLHMPTVDVFEEIVSARSCRPEAVPGRQSSHAPFATEWTNANPSSYRTEYRTPGGARFRIKQFLFDWAPPFAGQPNLWNHETRAFPLAGGDILWIGTDYKERPGAGAELRRTTIELSVIEGELTDEEIHAFYDVLAPVDADYADRHLALALHEIGYWQRFRPKWLKVPFSLWQPSPFTAFAMDDWRSPDAETMRILVGDRFASRIDGYEPETIGFFKLGTPKEAFDYKLRRRDDPRHGLRLYHRRLDDEGAHPATLTQTFSTYERILDQRPHCVDIAYISAEHGPFEYRIVDTVRRTETIAMFGACATHTMANCSALVLSQLCARAEA